MIMEIPSCHLSKARDLGYIQLPQASWERGEINRDQFADGGIWKTAGMRNDVCGTSLKSI